MNIIIRQVLLKDLEQITEIESCCFTKEKAATKEAFAQRILTFPESFFVAETDNRIVGFVNGCVTNTPAISDDLYRNADLHNPKGEYQTIFGLAVMPQYQNRGIAKQLMNFMLKKSKESGRRGIALTCKEALITFYERLGYVNKGISKSVHGGVVWYDMLLVCCIKDN